MQNLYDLIQEYNSKVRELEQRKRELYDAIREAISCVSLPGVTKISGNTAYVSISSIVSSKGYILSPEYYHSGRQAELVKRILQLGKPTVIVCAAGSAINTESDPDALLHIWYPGAEGGKAVAEILFCLIFKRMLGQSGILFEFRQA